MAKVQWKVDWALRWYVLKVDYELYGKDLTDSARLSGQIIREMGARPPLGFPFEMFLDEEGRKVSKSVGRGVTVDQWTRYAPIEVLKFFLLLNPRRARKLFLEAIPQYVDEYLDAVRDYAAEVGGAAARIGARICDSEREAAPIQFDAHLGLMMNAVAALGKLGSRFSSGTISVALRRVESSGDPETEKDGPCADGMRAQLLSRFRRADEKDYMLTEVERAQLKTLDTTCVKKPGRERRRDEEDLRPPRKITTSPAKFSRCYTARSWARSAARASGAFIRLATPAKIVEILDEHDRANRLNQRAATPANNIIRAAGFIAFATCLVACSATSVAAICVPSFPYDDGWLGGDAAYSIRLSDTRSIWLFGDSFVGDPGRNTSPWIQNGVQHDCDIRMRERKLEHPLLLEQSRRQRAPAIFYYRRRTVPLLASRRFLTVREARCT